MRAIPAAVEFIRRAALAARREMTALLRERVCPGLKADFKTSC